MAPAKKSIVWDFFNKNEEKVTCNICKTTYKNSNTTTNLVNHLKRKHPLQYTEKINLSECESAEPSTSSGNEEVPKKKQATLFKVAGKLSSVEKRRIDNALLNLIVWDHQPLSIVEQKGFVEYTKLLNPSYVLPSRKTLSSNMLDDHYKICRAVAQEKLRGVDYISCTTDLWSSDSNRSYITLTAHFIFDGKPQAITISTKEANFDHTAMNISQSMKESLDEWGIYDKIVAIVTDNAANVKKAVNEHLNKRNQYCVAHTLNLAINDCVKDNVADIDETDFNSLNLQNLLSKCRAIVSHFKHSDKSSYKLREVQKQMGLPELKVIQDIATRWNSQYYMMSRLLELKVPLSAAIVAISNPPNNLSNEEWTAVEDIVKILKPAEQATKIVSGEKYPTLSSTIPLINSMKDSIKRKNPVSEAGNKLQKLLLTVLDRRLGILDNNKTACKSTFLDPRFKKEGFSCNAVAERAQQWCLTELTNVISESRSRAGNNLITESLQENSNSIHSIDLPNNQMNENNADDDLWASFDEKMKTTTNCAPITNAAVLVKQYVESEYVDRKSDPLKFWEDRKSTNPDLYKMAIKYLCIPATSVPAERVFSEAGLLCNQRRNRLDPEKVDQILFLNSFTNNDM